MGMEIEETEGWKDGKMERWKDGNVELLNPQV